MWYFWPTMSVAPAMSSPKPSALAGASTAPIPKPSAVHTPTATPTPTPGLVVQEAKAYNVAMQNFAFAPASIIVKQGDVVVFQNNDQTQHTVTSDTAGAFDSGRIDPGSQWMLETANMAPGTYKFHCTIHPTMQGTLTIQPLTPAPSMSVAPSLSPSPTPQTYTVQMQNHTYVPAALTVTRGDTVIFVGSDAFYSVIVDGRASGRMQPNQPWTLHSSDFSAGTYQIHDAAYSTMRGTLVIQ
jgi:plastocyanin